MTPVMVLGLLLSLVAIAVAGIVGLRALVLRRAAAEDERGGAEADGLQAASLAEAAEGWGGAEPPEAPPSPAHAAPRRRGARR